MTDETLDGISDFLTKSPEKNILIPEIFQKKPSPTLLKNIGNYIDSV